MSGGEIETVLDRPTMPPGTAAKAIAYLTRTGNADLLPILGLVVDPVAAAKSRAKAQAGLNGKGLK